jgi:hypothetical protein
MVYSIYETDCIIFGIRNIQENDALIKAFSDKFGIINIIATSFRKESSKLKANTKAFSINRLALVRGKEFFRLTGSDHLFSFSSSKSIVQFLRKAESLFFSDEMEYFDQINSDIYNMIIYMCKFITYIVKSDKENKTELIQLAHILFIVYIKGLQGFVEKIDISQMKGKEKEGMENWLKDKELELRKSILKIDTSY